MTEISLSPLHDLCKNTSRFGSRTALIDNRHSWTFQELYEQVLSIATWLKGRGICPGNRIAVLSGDNTEYFLAMYGIWAAGGIFAPINPTIPSSHRDNILEKLSPHICILGTEMEINPAELNYRSAHLPDNIEKIKNFSVYKPSSKDVASILFTSGSTGVPKGVVNTHKAMADNARLTAETLEISEEDRIFINTPAYYTSAIVHLLTMFSKGGSLATQRGFLFGESLVESIKTYRCTGFGGAPVHLTRLLNSSEDVVLPNCFRFLVSSGDHLPAHVIKGLLDRFSDISLYCIYGLTEVAGRLCILPPKKIQEKMGSVGLPLPDMDVTVVKENDLKPAPPGEIGEVYVSGPLLTDEYFRDNESSKLLKTKKGFQTGDYGYKDKDGYLYISGRKDDIFKSGGEKVSTVVIQQAVSILNVFEDITVIPIKDEVLGRIPAVFYVSTKNQEINFRNITRILRKVLPSNYVPRKFYQVDYIPRTGSGKVIKNKLEQMLDQRN